MSTEKPCHFAHLLQVSKNIFEVWFYTWIFMFLYMYIASWQGQTTLWGQNFYININLLSLVICCKFLPHTVFPIWKNKRPNLILPKQVKINIESLFEQIMMGPRPQCYIPSHKVTGPLVLEKKIFEGFLPYMGMVAILVMWSRPSEQTFFPPTHGGSTWNLALIGQVVWRRRSLKMMDGRQMTDGPWLY